MQEPSRRVTGNVRVEDRVRGRVWVAAFVQADGSKTRKTLGPVWAKDSGRKTKRGAVVWRAADGSKPDETYLTPRDAQDALEALLAAERAKPSGQRRVKGKTFGDACDAWLDRAEHFDAVAETTLRGYKSIVGKLEAEFGRQTALRRIVASRIERYQEDLLALKGDAKLSRSTIHTRMRVLSAVLARARALGWVGTNAAGEVEIIPMPAPDPDFNVLEPEQVEAVADAVAGVLAEELPLMRNGKIDQHALSVMRERRAMWAEAVRLAAFTGLRFGELRALRWRDVDWDGRNVHVRRNLPTSAPAKSKPKSPKGKRGRSLPLIDQGVELLERIRERGYATGPDDLVLPTRGAGMLEPGRVRNAFYRGLGAAGLGHLREKDNPMTFHDLRHTFGSLAVRRLPLSDVQAFMGHADIATTMRYVHHVPRTDAALRLSEAFASGASRRGRAPRKRRAA